ncbi:hypothetical protein FSP39_001970 [Pinctada imbricata]|uniref:Uncharacterized protein n=1 Tax=Pinctada imbricata TaxID=66713 RepID=A0AA89BS95_PINIB|nr:hypothetical protein FSP39_001970 [Pinctada imbricata]
MSLHSNIAEKGETNEQSEIVPSTSRTEKDNGDIKAMMAAMQKQIFVLTSTVTDLKKGEKRKGSQDKKEEDENKRQRADADSDSENEDQFDKLLYDSDDGDINMEILNELAECFGSDEKSGEPINDKLAEVANEGVRTKLCMDKIKECSEKYLRPKNVKNLVVPRINEEIRPHLNRQVKNQDVRLQKTQSLVCKAIVPQLQQLDMLMKSKKGGGQIPVRDITKLAMDGLKLMTFVYCDLSYRRRELIIQPDKNEEFRGLCSNDYPVTDNLFGDDLGKRVEELMKANKIGSKISGHKRSFQDNRQSHKKHYTGHKSFSQASSSYRSQPFLGQRTTNSFRKKNMKQRKQ